MLVNSMEGRLKMLVNAMEGRLTDAGECYGRKVDRCW